MESVDTDNCSTGSVETGLNESEKGSVCNKENNMKHDHYQLYAR